MVRMFAVLCLAALLAACSSHPAPSDTSANAAPAPAATNALAGTPMATYGHDLNRARNVQNIVNDQAKKQAQAIKKATSGGR